MSTKNGNPARGTRKLYVDYNAGLTTEEKEKKSEQYIKSIEELSRNEEHLRDKWEEITDNEVTNEQWIVYMETNLDIKNLEKHLEVIKNKYENKIVSREERVEVKGEVRNIGKSLNALHYSRLWDM